MWGCLTVLGVTKQILAFQGIKGSVFFLISQLKMGWELRVIVDKVRSASRARMLWVLFEFVFWNRICIS